MNELELTRAAFREPAADTAARERARVRLLQAIDEEERRRRRPSVRSRLAVLAAAAALATVVILVVVVVTTPFGGQSAAAAELRRLGAIASTNQALTPGVGEFVLARSDELRPEARTDLVSGLSFTVLSRLRIENWIASDGSGYRRTEVISVDFASASDREAWEQAGRPEVQQAGGVRLERYRPGKTPWFDVGSLPTDPEQLLEVLRSGSPIPWPSSDDKIFKLIGSLLAQGDASPELRSALFEVATELEGVQLIGEVTDPLDRQGVGLVVDGTASRTQLVFDPATSHLLAIEFYPINDGSIGALESWAASEPAMVVDSAPAQ
jgi:hypothetical protein